MAKYIEQESFIRWVREFRPGDSELVSAIINAPAADVEPVRHGTWIDNGACGYKWAFACSKCGYLDGYPFNER